MKIAIDCHGGDHSPRANVRGAVRALEDHGDLSLVLVGDEKAINAELDSLAAPGGGDKDAKSASVRERVEIVHAPDVITGEDKPTDAIRLKPDSSMIRAIRILREEPDVAALVSIGATGALVASATLRIGRIRGIRRPAFCPIMPTVKGGIVGVCDSGANVDVIPEQLREFALMGSAYLECVYGVERPRVALLNIGTESEKGDELRRRAYALLSETPEVNFVGNMESRDLLTGKYDLVVCDGFAGNVLVKTTEGTALELLRMMKGRIKSKKRYLMGAALMKDMFGELKDFMNYQNYGGSVLLGATKTVVKGHGASDEKAVAVCVDQAYRMAASDMNERISAGLRAFAEREKETKETNENV